MVHTTSPIFSSARAGGGQAVRRVVSARRVLWSLCGLLTACSPAILPEAERLSPEQSFAQEARPVLVESCAGCHAQKIGPLPPFLEPGNEYASISGYKGGFFLTRPAELSYLLHRGPHAGPALSSQQAQRVFSWLKSEVEPASLRLSPAVTLEVGEQILSLETLVASAGAYISFRVETLSDVPDGLRLADVTIVAGRDSGLYIKHPQLLLSTPAGIQKDVVDSFSSVELRLAAGQSQRLGGGSVILNRVPTPARLLMAFEALQRFSGGQPVSDSCAALPVFTAQVLPKLRVECARACHGGASAGATATFSMASAISGDDSVQDALCQRTRARINIDAVATSFLLKQITKPPIGLANHEQYKTPDPAGFTGALATWAAAEVAARPK